MNQAQNWVKQTAAIAHANLYWAVQTARQRIGKGKGNDYFIGCQGATSPGEIKGSGLQIAHPSNPE